MVLHHRDTYSVSKKDDAAMTKAVEKIDTLDKAISQFRANEVSLFCEKTARTRLEETSETELDRLNYFQYKVLVKMEALIKANQRPVEYKVSELIRCVKAGPLNSKGENHLLDLIKRKLPQKSLLTDLFTSKNKTLKPQKQAPVRLKTSGQGLGR